MRLKNFVLIILSVTMLGIGYDADAQRNKYKKRRKTSKNISKYRGGTRGFGRFKPYSFVGVNINAANYFGDLSPVNKAASTDISFTRPGLGIYAGYKFHSQVAVRAAFNYFRISADDFSADPTDEEAVTRYTRNLSFRNDLKELQLGFQFWLFPNYGSYRQRPPLNIGLFLGGAVVLHEPLGQVPEADYQLDQSGNTPVAGASAGEWVKLRELGTEGQNLGLTDEYSNIAFAIPLTVALDLRIPGTNLNAGIEAGVRYTFTDYLDDVSTNYVDLDLFDDPLARIFSDRSSEPTNFDGEARDQTAYSIIQQNGFNTAAGGYGASGAKRGGSDQDDFYFVTQFKLTYFVGNAAKRRSSKGRGRAKFR